jgi:sensor c-di-GMP phosphodiesterase-like protein
MHIPRPKNQLILVASTVFLTFLLCGFVLFAFQQFVLSQQQQHATRLLSQVEMLIEESQATLSILNRNPDVVCDAEYLLFLKQMMFQVKYIKDIGLIEANKIKCSISKGILNEPLSLPESDIHLNSGAEIIISSPLELFDFDYSALRIRNGRFSVVNELKEVVVDLDDSFDWQLGFEGNSEFVFLLGNAQLLTSIKNKYSTLVSYFNGYSKTCANTTSFCVVSAVNVGEFITGQMLAFLALLLIALILLSFLAVSRVLLYFSSVEKRLIHGLNNDAFYPLFQPILCLKSGEFAGCEVLARFRDRHGELYPDEFIKLLTKLDLTFQFTKHIITESLAQINTYKDHNIKKINFNLCPRDLEDEKVSELVSLLKGISEYEICFEITEDETFESAEAVANVTRLRQAGFTIAIDDFGTG